MMSVSIPLLKIWCWKDCLWEVPFGYDSISVFLVGEYFCGVLVILLLLCGNAFAIAFYLIKF